MEVVIGKKRKMISTFNLEKLNTMLHDFNNLTHIRITIFDEDFHELTSYPKEIVPICHFIRENSDAAAACHRCDLRACRIALHIRKPYIYQCHAGLTEAVTPVFMGNLPVAYLLVGHLFSYPSKEDGWNRIRESCRKYDLDEEKLHELVRGLSLTSQEDILSASHIVQAVASYLCFDQMISLKQQELPVQLDAYITQHLAEKLDTRILCKHFHIGKTSLYKISKSNYGEGIIEHIRKLRIQHAQKLLTEEPEQSIESVAGACGFHDPNYFMSAFKKITGITPGKYRTQHKNV